MVLASREQSSPGAGTGASHCLRDAGEGGERGDGGGGEGEGGAAAVCRGTGGRGTSGVEGRRTSGWGER